MRRAARLGLRVPGGPSGVVPATLSLSLGTPATFGAFVPGVAPDYTAGHDGQRHLHRG